MNTKEEELLAEARALLEPQSQMEKLHDSELICECVCITAGDIRNYLREKNKELNLSELGYELKLGSGCSSCKKSFESWKSRI